MKNQIFKLSLAFCIAVGLSTASYAQASDKTWSFGPELGVNFSKYGKDADDTDYKNGLLAGGFLTYSIRNTHAFTLKVLYSQKGAADEASDSKTHLNYIEVPVLARLFFNREGTIRPNIFAGPSFGFLTGVKGKVGDGNYEEVANYKDIYNNFDLGLGFGIGINFKVAEEMYFIVDTRYTYGLSDLSKSSASEVNNLALAFSAGLSFGLSNK